MSQTGVPYADFALNIYKWFCTRISAGCKNCYALELGKRYPQNTSDHIEWRESAMNECRQWQPGAFVFVNDMSDTYHEGAPLGYIQRIHEIIAEHPQQIFLTLTKRPTVVNKLASILKWPSNLWFGVTVESADYTSRLPLLRRIPAAVRWVSYEPALGSLDKPDLSGVDWLVCGAESGANRRYFELNWAREAQALCAKQGVAFYFKQSTGQFPGMRPDALGQLYQDFPGGIKPLRHQHQPEQPKAPTKQLSLWGD